MWLRATHNYPVLAFSIASALILPLSVNAGAKKITRDIQAPLRDLVLRIDANIYFGGLHAGIVKLNAVVKNGTYQAKADTRSLGMANYLVKWRGSISAKGNIKNGILRPTYHTRHDKSRWGKRSVIMDYGDGRQAPNVVLKEDSGKNPYRKRDKVPARQTINTYDHLSGVLAAVLRAGLTGKAACGRPIPFFDGKRRFNITLKPMGKDTLRRSRYSAFHGPARKCRMQIDRIAGFSHKWMREKQEALTNGAKEDEIIVWFAPFKNGQIQLPVKVEASNFLGVGFLHPSRIDIDRKTRIALKR